LNLLTLRRRQGNEFEAMKEAHAVPHYGPNIELRLLSIRLWQEEFQADHFSGPEVAGDDRAHPRFRQFKAAAVNSYLAILAENAYYDGELGAISRKAST
jgi:hypothetical protein